MSVLMKTVVEYGYTRSIDMIEIYVWTKGEQKTSSNFSFHKARKLMCVHGTPPPRTHMLSAKNRFLAVVKGAWVNPSWMHGEIKWFPNKSWCSPLFCPVWQAVLSFTCLKHLSVTQELCDVISCDKCKVQLLLYFAHHHAHAETTYMAHGSHRSNTHMLRKQTTH